MKVLQYVLLFMVIAGISSCSNAIFEEHQNVASDLKWEPSDVKTFTFNIPDTQPYDITIALRHHSALGRPTAPPKISTLRPDTDKGKAIPFLILDQNNNLVGEAAGDICDTEMTILSKFSFPKAGEYTMTVAQTGEEPIPGMMQVGVKIEPLEQEK